MFLVKPPFFTMPSYMYLFPTLLCIRGTADLKPNLPTLLCRDTTTHQFIQPWEGCWKLQNRWGWLSKWCLMLTRFGTWVAPVFLGSTHPDLKHMDLQVKLDHFPKKNRGLKIKKNFETNQPSWWLRLANISDWQKKTCQKFQLPTIHVQEFGESVFYCGPMLTW